MEVENKTKMKKKVKIPRIIRPPLIDSTCPLNGNSCELLWKLYCSIGETNVTLACGLVSQAAAAAVLFLSNRFLFDEFLLFWTKI